MATVTIIAAVID